MPLRDDGQVHAETIDLSVYLTNNEVKICLINIQLKHLQREYRVAIFKINRNNHFIIN